MKLKSVPYLVYFFFLVYITLLFIIPNNSYAETFNINPEVSIQDLIDSAADGDLIILGLGTYVGDIDFKSKKITILGAGKDTVIQGSGNSPVVSFVNGENNESILDSVTITDGNEEGAILIKDASPIIRRCYIRSNRSIRNASAIFVDGELVETIADVDVSTPAIINNNIIAFNRRNKREGKVPAIIFIKEASPEIFNNSIVRNDNDGILILGNSSPRIRNNIFFRNGSSRRVLGSGIRLDSIPAESNIVISYNLFSRNELGSVFYEDADGDFSRFQNAELTEFEEFLTETFTGEDSSFTGNISGDPKFIKIRKIKDLRLRKNSPARDSGDPADFDPNNSRVNLGANGGEFGVYR